MEDVLSLHQETSTYHHVWLPLTNWQKGTGKWGALSAKQVMARPEVGGWCFCIMTHGDKQVTLCRQGEQHALFSFVFILNQVNSSRKSPEVLGAIICGTRASPTVDTRADTLNPFWNMQGCKL